MGQPRGSQSRGRFPRRRERLRGNSGSWLARFIKRTGPHIRVYGPVLFLEQGTLTLSPTVASPNGSFPLAYTRGSVCLHVRLLTRAARFGYTAACLHARIGLVTRPLAYTRGSVTRADRIGYTAACLRARLGGISSRLYAKLLRRRRASNPKPPAASRANVAGSGTTVEPYWTVPGMLKSLLLSQFIVRSWLFAEVL